MNEHQQRAGPGHAFVAAQQFDRLAAHRHFSLAQRIGERRQDQYQAGNPEPTADPDHVEQMQCRIEDKRRDGQREQRHRERQHLPAEQSSAARRHCHLVTTGARL